jgi:hypothetical protein
MKSVIFASIVASALAFAPVAKGYVGNTGPEPMFIGESGSTNFDPAGFCEVGYDKQYTFCVAAQRHKSLLL